MANCCQGFGKGIVGVVAKPISGTLQVDSGEQRNHFCLTLRCT